MTPGKQIRYIAAFFAVSIIVIPLIILYSMGYRLSDKLKIVKTGGIYITNSEPDVVLSINGKPAKSAGFVDRNILLRDLKPGIYKVSVTKDGARNWEKYVRVEEQMVEVLFPLIVPSEFEKSAIPRYLPAEKPKKKGKKKPREINEDYSDVVELFREAKKPRKDLFPAWNRKEIAALRLGANRKLKDKVLLINERNSIYVKWTGKEDQLPFYINTMKKKKIYSPKGTVTSFDFYPMRSDAFLVRFDNGSLYAVEIDTRFGEQNYYRVLKYCSRFLVYEEMLFYFIGDTLYSIDFDQ